MTTLNERIDQIHLVLSSLLDGCTDCDPRKVAIARTEFEKSFVWLKYATADYKELSPTVTITIPFTCTGELERNEDNTVNIASNVGTLAVYNGVTYLGQGSNRSASIRDLKEVLINTFPTLIFNLQEVIPTTLIASSIDNKWHMQYDDKDYYADSEEDLWKITSELNKKYPQSVFQIQKEVPKQTIRLTAYNEGPTMSDPYGKKWYVTYMGNRYYGSTVIGIVAELAADYPSLAFHITGMNR